MREAVDADAGVGGAHGQEAAAAGGEADGGPGGRKNRGEVRGYFRAGGREGQVAWRVFNLVVGMGKTGKGRMMEAGRGRGAPVEGADAGEARFRGAAVELLVVLSEDVQEDCRPVGVLSLGHAALAGGQRARLRRPSDDVRPAEGVRALAARAGSATRSEGSELKAIQLKTCV